MASLQKAKLSAVLWAVWVNVCRLLLAATFVFSGFVKALDPSGNALKIKEYGMAWGLHEQTDGFYFLLLGFGLMAVEFLLGTSLLLGIRRRISTLGALLFMAVMTPLSLYLALANPVEDCGCFGDAWKLTNWETFGKNVFLLLFAVCAAVGRKKIVPVFRYGFQWIAPLYSLLFVLFYAFFCHTHLPLIDFRPYKIGTDLALLRDTPDENGNYVDVSFYDPATFDEVTDSLLASDRYVFLLIAPRIEEADEGDVDLVNDLYDYCREQDYGFYCITSSPEEEVAAWTDRTGADYPFLSGDNTTLLTIVRSNPGLLLLRHGVVLNKWHHSQLPADSLLNRPLDDHHPIVRPQRLTPQEVCWQAVVWYFLPLIVIFLIDRYMLRPMELYHVRRKRKKHNTNPLINHTAMRKNIVAGNWKMNKTLQEGIALAKELNDVLAGEKPNCDVIICTPFIHLASVVPVVDASKIGVGAENCADKESGAYTGEVSAAMVASTGAKYVILGHSERRAYYHETPELLKTKVELALANGLTPIFCVGEVLEEREAGKQNEVVGSQLAASLFGLSAEDFGKIILAYEPVWAIGTGKTATAAQAQEMHAFIRSAIAGKYGQEVADNTSILYGGSCKASNAKELFANPDVDGGLIGGASLKAADFKGIIDAFN